MSVGTHSIPEIAAIKVSVDITADNWLGKVHVLIACHCNNYTLTLKNVKLL
jgi:hypothetical protein